MEKAEWVTDHLDQGHTVTKEDGSAYCSCGAYYAAYSAERSGSPMSVPAVAPSLESATNDHARICPHGSLRRQCELCDAFVEIATLRAQVDQLTADLSQAKANADGLLFRCADAENAKEDLERRLVNAETNWSRTLANYLARAEAAEQRLFACKEDKDFIEMIKGSKSPCGHWSSYAYSPDGKGKQILCLRCELDAAEQRLRDLAQGLKTGPCNLSVLRGVVDTAILEWSRRSGGQIQRGYASWISAALWTHLQSALDALPASGSQGWQPIATAGLVEKLTELVRQLDVEIDRGGSPFTWRIASELRLTVLLPLEAALKGMPLPASPEGQK